MDYLDLSQEEKEKLCRLLQSIMFFSEDQYAFLSGEQEMTQEVFENCLAACIAHNDLRELNAICDQYPLFTKIWMRKMDQELKSMNLPHRSEEEKKIGWENFKKQMKKRYGIDFT